MKQRLITLMKSVKFPPFPGGNCDVRVEHQLPEHAFEAVAEHLMKNGVIALPCREGDVVYPLNADRRFRAFIDNISINTTGITFEWVQYDIGPDCAETWDEGSFELNDIGKTVFLDEPSYLIALEKGEK